MAEAGDAEEFDYFAWRKLADSFPCAPAKGLPKLTTPDAVLHRKLSPTLDAGDVAAELEGLVHEAITNGAHLCVGVVPSWRDEMDLARSFLALRDEHQWDLKRLSRGLLAQTQFVRIALHRSVAIASDGRPIESVPMVLGPFPQFPRSRFCPHPIFEMSVCTEATKVIDGKHRINFLGIPLPKLSSDQREALMQTAKAETVAVNEGADVRAKPNVTATFTLGAEPLFN